MKSKHFAFDTEDDSRGKPYLYNFFDIGRVRHFTFFSQSDALDFVTSNPNRVYWAVNLEYDINNLFRGHFSLLHYVYAGSRLITAEFPNDSIRFLDTMNHWPISVAKMGARINLPKLTMRHGGKPPLKKDLKKCLQLFI